MTETEVTRDILNRLISAVEVNEFDKGFSEEYTTLGRLAVRAGLMWRCVNHGCRCLNHLNNPRCDNCNSRKPKDREIPQPERF